MTKSLRILGIRGIPCRHGGFESFAEDLAPFLVQRGWAVTVYCQNEGDNRSEEWWRGVRLIHLPTRRTGAVGTIAFDWHSTCDAAAANEPVLVLGYNTALFSLIYRIRGITHVLNADGFEWKRQKYNLLERAWLLANEFLGCRLADHLVADHPVVRDRYTRALGVCGVTTVPYGSRVVHTAKVELLQPWRLIPQLYVLVIARPEPENYIAEIVRAYSTRRRGRPLIVLGNYDRRVRYHRRVLDEAGPEVIFPGAVYDRDALDALRHFTSLYIHGHRVGGTNPSLVEALGAASPVLAHDNRFNRWVCGNAGMFFRDEAELSARLSYLVDDGAEQELAALRDRARLRHASMFNLETRLGEYEHLLLKMIGVGAGASPESATPSELEVA